jgi:hypothetical protein
MRWVWDVISWDDALPLIPILAHEALSLLIGRGPSALVCLMFLMPGIAGLIAQKANQKLAKLRCGPTLGRQILIAAAIVVLFFCEVVWVCISLGRDVPLELYSIVGGAYLVYLVLILAALRPDSETWRTGKSNLR